MWIRNIENIESFFLDTILRISMGGLFIVLLANLLLFPEDTLSIYIVIAILLACIISYVIRRKFPTVSVLIITSVALVAMVYQRLTVPNTSTTLTVVIIVGFIFSVMLKGKVMWVMHAIAFTIINTLFVFHLPDAVTAAITYSILYFIITFATGVLKTSYDRINGNLRDSNVELNEKAKEIETQNEELLQIQENLSTLNRDLEKIVNERTTKIQIQNKIMLQYSYTNAHHLRGPVARLLGLADVYRLEPQPDPDFFIEKMVEEAKEIDSVIKKINVDLEVSSEEIKEENPDISNQSTLTLQ